MAVDHNNPQSRNEEILIAAIDGTEYNKLPQSRIEELLLELKEVIEEGGSGGGGIHPIGVTTTPIYDGATTNPIQINGESYTAETGDMVTYQSTEFLFNVNEVWQELGDVSIVLAIIDNIFADIAPAFDDTSAYAVDDYVIYNDQLYKCIAAHTGAWDENDFTATTISDEITEVADAVDDIKDGTDIDSFADVETALADKVNKVNGKDLSTNDYDDTEKAAVAAATSAISAMKDGTDLDSFGDVEIALLDKVDISDLGTAAAKDSTNSVTSGSTDLVESGAVKDAIDAAVSSAYHHAGTKTVAQLTHDLLVAVNEGNVYNITDSGTTTSDFIEGIGKTIDEGSNVGICKVGDVYMFDLLSGFVDTTNFVQKSQTSGLLKNDGTVNEEIEGDVEALKDDVDAIDSKIDDATTYPYADVITIPDAIPANLADCSVKIEPVQDLHGYDHPWVGGAGKNKCPNKAYKANSYTMYVGQDDDTSFPFALVGGTTYTLSFVSELSPILIYLREENAASGTLVNNTFTPSASGNYRIGISVEGIDTTNVSNIQLELGSSATVYEPYSNICPITGHTEASVQRDGKNLFDESTIKQNRSINENGIPYITNNYDLSDYIRITGSSLIISGDNSNKSIIVGFYDKDKEFISFTAATTNTTVTIPNNACYVRFDMYKTRSNIQLELGSSATDYEPFNGKTYTIALGDTIYGGTVDFDSGVMTVTHALANLGDIAWTYQETSETFRATGGAFEIAGYPIKKSGIVDIKCSIYPEQQEGLTDKYISQSGTSSNIFIKDTDYGTDTSAFKAAMDSVQLCYELATPITIQLTPQQIQLLKGQNTLTASTGDISVTVNGVSGAIGQVQEQVNELEEELIKQLPNAPTTDGTYNLRVTVVDGVPTYSWESAV